MNELTKERLAEIEARCEAATPGPWEWDDEAECMRHGSKPVMMAMWYYDKCGEVVVSLDVYDADAEFTAHARQDIPALLDEVKRLREQLKNLDLAYEFDEDAEAVTGEPL